MSTITAQKLLNWYLLGKHEGKYIQGDFETCADILTCNRTIQKVTIGSAMPYTERPEMW
jgi:hypothetical protein